MSEYLFTVDWEKLFIPSTPLLEIFLRGSLVYLALFLMLRFVLKRESGTLGITDLLVVVLLADAAQNAMADDYRAIPDGLLLVATIVFWAYALDWMGYRFPRIRRLVHPQPLKLVEDGKMILRNLRKEFISEEELFTTLREQGVEDISRVRHAYMEGDGRISVITIEEQRHNPPEKKVE
jgi:uncharacterized membrane protein YcaP (DUF421 family)